MGRRAPRQAPVAVLRSSWIAAVNGGTLWDLLAEKTQSNPTVLVLVDLAGRRVGDPDVPRAACIEGLIDLLHDRLDVAVNLAASCDESRLYAGNRDIYALADLLGYRFVTTGGRAYDIVDLGQNLRADAFSQASSLSGTGLSADWIDAGFRLNFAMLRGDPAEVFAGGLRNLLGALPLADKRLHYQHRRDPGEVVADVLTYYPPDFTLVEAPAQSGRIQDGFCAASASPLLADFCAALKSGVDPYSSPLFAAVAQKHRLPRRYRIDGSLKPRQGLPKVAPPAQRAALARRKNEAGDRLLSAWLAELDPELFPAERPLDARVQDVLGQLIGDGTSPAGNALRTALDLAAGLGGYAANAWRTLFSKDLLFRRPASLGIDPPDPEDRAFLDLVDEIEALRRIVDATPESAPGLRWRKFEKAVLFEYSYWTAIPFETFTGTVDVARVISFLNDYLGGTLVVLATDRLGRPIRQAERNLYLPQPNYLVLYGGQPIDVTKIETVVYGKDHRRLYWKTLCSTNGSATADDGMASFQREKDGTRVIFAGKQRFTLPLFFQLFDVSLVPELETALTTDAYRRFFDRTRANLEALVEGRAIAIGRPPCADTDFPSLALERWMASVAERAGAWLKPAASEASISLPDAAGFIHVVPGQ